MLALLGLLSYIVCMKVNVNSLESSLKFQGSYYFFLQHVGLTIRYKDSVKNNNPPSPGVICFKPNNVEQVIINNIDGLMIPYNFIPYNTFIVFGTDKDVYRLLHNTDNYNVENYGFTVDSVLSNVEGFVTANRWRLTGLCDENTIPSRLVSLYLLLGEDAYVFAEKYPNVGAMVVAYLKYYGLYSESVVDGFNKLPFRIMWEAVKL